MNKKKSRSLKPKKLENIVLDNNQLKEIGQKILEIDISIKGDSSLPGIKKLNKKKNKRYRWSYEEIILSLDYIRVQTKYQLFDLEATRRENRYLRELIQNYEDD